MVQLVNLLLGERIERIGEECWGGGGEGLYKLSVCNFIILCQDSII